MDRGGSRLAARFRKAVLDQDDSRNKQEDSARRAREAAQAARLQLLADLASIGREIGALRVEEGKDGLTLRFRERYLHFGPEGDGDRVRVEFEGMGDEENALYRQAELGDKWVHSRRRRGREDRAPLFDQGLEDLLVRGLGLPKPGSAPDADPASASDPGRKRL
jgi:hypothetical protein